HPYPPLFPSTTLFRSVHCKSIEAQEMRAVLTARKLLQSKLHDVENCLRGVLRGFGLKVGKTTDRSFATRIEALVAGHSGLTLVRSEEHTSELQSLRHL